MNKITAYFSQHARIPSQELFWLMRQLATLLEANIPLVTALQNLLFLQQRKTLRQVLEKITADVVSGVAFSHALSRHPRYFSVFTCQLMQAGEQTAALPLALTQWIAYQEQLIQLSQRIRKALFYPAIVVGLSLVITMGLLLFIVPQFQALFASFNAPLPTLTRMVLSMATGLRNYGGGLCIFLFSSIFLLYIAKQRVPRLSYYLAAWRLRLPWVGRWQKYAMVARIARTLALTITAQVPLVQGLNVSIGIAQHWQYAQALTFIKNAVAQGETLANAFQQTGCFDLFVVQLVRTGEQSGRLSPMLLKAAGWYDSQLDHAVMQLSQWLEPVMMVVLGILIGGLVIAMYLPIFQLGKVI